MSRKVAAVTSFFIKDHNTIDGNMHQLPGSGEAHLAIMN